MSTKTLKDDKKLVKNMMISQKCLGIVLKRVENCENIRNGDTSGDRNLTIGTNCDSAVEDWVLESGYLIFQDFQEANRQCFWNQTFVDSINNLEYMGYVAPGTLLVSGNEYYLEALRSAWGRRVLKSPPNFFIARVGDVTGLEMQVIPQTQFTPLPEALCLVISELNSGKETASLEIIFSYLQDRFSDMIVPNQDIVYVSLGKLIKDRKVYHTGEGYFIVTPETYHVTTVSSLREERPLLLTNEEAIHRLHGNELLSPTRATRTETRSIQTNHDDLALCAAGSSPSIVCHMSTGKLERSGSLRLSRKEKHKSKENGSFVRSESMRLSPEKSKSLIKDINLKSSPVHRDVEKGEKVSVFSKLFRRSSSKRRKSSKSPAKYASFSAQFPPLEWSDPNIIHYHSRSTQTLDGRSSTSLYKLGSSKLFLGEDERPIVLSNSVASRTMSNSATMTSPQLTSSSTSNNILSNNNNNNINSNGTSSPTSMKSKTDSVNRTRSSERSNSQEQHRHLHVRSSTVESVHLDKCAYSTKPTSSSSDAPVTNISNGPLTATTFTSPKSSTGVHRKSQSHSCTVLQDSARKNSAPTQLRKGSSSHLKKTLTSTPVKSSSSRQHAKHVTTENDQVSTRDTAKVSNVEHRVSVPSYSSSSGHRSRLDANRTEGGEAKVKNTELRNDEEYNVSEVYGSASCFGSDIAEKHSGKLLNRWSVHGGESGSSVSGVMNNVVGPKKGVTSGVSSSRSSGIKCINKLHGDSLDRSSGSSPRHQSNVTAAVRPTQAIRPMNLPDKETSSDSLKSDANKLLGTATPPNATNETSLTTSPSYDKTFDIESSAFKSITAQKLLKGASINSIDTIVEVNMAAEKNDSAAAAAAKQRNASIIRRGSSSFSIGHGGGTRIQLLNNGKSQSGTVSRIVGEAHKMPSVSEVSTGAVTTECAGDTKLAKSVSGGGGGTKVIAKV